MNIARKWTRLLGLTLLMIALLFAVTVSVLAEEDPIEFAIEVSPDSLTEPGEVKVSLKVANTGSEDMIDPVTLYDPAGNVVTSFGDGGSYILSAGAFRTWEGTWKVTEEELNAEEFAYTVKYHLEDEDGEMVAVSSTAVGHVAFTGEKVDLSVTRTISPEIVRSGATASAIYELYNSGNVDLTNIRVEEKISKKAQTVDALKVGEKKTLTFTSKIGNADLTSSASITYKAKGDSKTYKKQVEEAAIPLAKPNLKVQLSSPTTGVNIGESAQLVITFINEGNVSYSNVSVSDAKKGEIATNLSIPAGATVTETIEFILMEKTDFKVTATLPDNTGETKTVTTDPLTIGVFDPEKTLLLTLNLTCDHETVEKAPADVRFTLNVTNNSNVKAEKIAISHGDQSITTIAALEPGASTTIVRDVRISQAGKFCFTASAKDAMNNTVTFDSNTLQLSYAPPTTAPTPVVRVTVAPPVFVTPVPAESVLGQVRNVLLMAAAVIGALFALGFVLFLISSVVRLKKNSKSKAAYDHLELAERRDYSEPADEFDYDDDTAAEEEIRVERSEEEHIELPHEKLVKPLTEEEFNQAEDHKEPEEATDSEKLPDTDGEGGYRVSRNAEEQAKPRQETAEETSAPRRRAHRRVQRTEDGEE